MKKRMPYLLIAVLILVTSSLVYGQHWYYNERPQEPLFPNISNRLRALGEDFSGIISDLETDALQNPSLAAFLESKSIGITFLPYFSSHSSYFPPTCLSILLPNIPTSKLTLGFHNQWVYTASGYSYEPVYDYGHYYWADQYNFYSYQQLFFLAYTPSVHFSIAPFYIFTKSPYQEHTVSSSDHISNNTNYSYSQTSNEMSQYHDNVLYHRFGIGTTCNYQTNSFQLTASFKRGDNKINFDGDYTDNLFSVQTSHSYNDSFYNYYYYYMYHNDTSTLNINKTKNANEINVSFRWQKQIDNDNTFNALIHLSKSTTDLSGSELGDVYESEIDSSLHRWRNYPNPESIEIFYRYSNLNNNQDSSHITGTTNSLNLIFGLGYEARLNRRLNSYVGIKSTFEIASDTFLKSGRMISVVDTTVDTTGICESQMEKSRSFSIALPIGLEYKVLPSLRIRSGFAPKLIYSKSGLTTHEQLENVTGFLVYSFGVGYIFRDKFSIDTYNYGNLGSLNNWNIQLKYMF